MELHRLTLHGHDLAFRSAGEGPVLLLVHGMAGSSGTWRPVLPALAERFTVVAPDLLGHGASAKPADGDYSLGAQATSLRDLLVALGHPRATVVGQSLGGGIAMQFAYQFPERCERLVVVGSGGLGREVSPLLRVLALPGVEYALPLVFNSFLRDAARGVVHGLGRVGLRTSPQLTEIRRSADALVEPECRSAFVRTLRSVVDPGGQQVSARNRLGLAADVPSLIVWGDRDPIIPVEHAYAANRAMPGSRLEVFEGVGHYPHCEAPDRFVDVITDFVRSTPAAHLGAEAPHRDVPASA